MDRDKLGSSTPLSAKDEAFVKHLPAFTIGLSRREVQLIRCLVELTRELEDVDREFTAQMLSMECRMTGALINYSKSLAAEGSTLPDPLPSLPPSTIASASASESGSPAQTESSRPPRPQPGPYILVNDLVLIDSGQLLPCVPAVPVGSVLRLVEEPVEPADDPVDAEPPSGTRTERTGSSPTICTPDTHDGILLPPPSATPADSPKLVDLEGGKRSDLHP